MAEAVKSRVWFTDLRTDTGRNLFDKLGELFARLEPEKRLAPGHLTAVKLHFGEKGNTAFIPPVFVRRLVDEIKKTGSEPFLTDTNTLYLGKRTNSASHLRTAMEHGFGYAVTGAPIIIADGLRGGDGVEVKISGTTTGTVQVAREIVDSDALVVLTHFKCHEMTGFGGALKNVGMGCASRHGKLHQHSNLPPVVDPEGCTACGACAAVCPAGAIEVGKAAVIDPETCIGCGHCVTACPENTIKVEWNETTDKLQVKMADHVSGALKGKDGRVMFVNFVTRVSPLCDCYGHADAPIVPDVGILASTDPVAIDQASADLVNAQQGFQNTALKTGHQPGGDKFRGVHPEVDWTVQLKAASSLALGTTCYELLEI